MCSPLKHTKAIILIPLKPSYNYIFRYWEIGTPKIGQFETKTVAPAAKNTTKPVQQEPRHFFDANRKDRWVSPHAVSLQSLGHKHGAMIVS